LARAKKKNEATGVDAGGETPSDKEREAQATRIFVNWVGRIWPELAWHEGAAGGRVRSRGGGSDLCLAANFAGVGVGGGQLFPA
jgi:hypothetical protein